MPSWRVRGSIPSEPAQLELDAADFKLLENNSSKQLIVEAACCLVDLQVLKQP